MPTQGVFFLANDGIYDLTIAFLNSFRVHNPTLALCLIPFGDDIERLSKLAAKYDFTIFDDQAMMTRCDEISRKFHGRVIGNYRKFVAWHGPFDEFIYIDSDSVVTADVSFAFEFLEDHAFVFSHSDAPFLRRYVWKETLEATGALTPEQIAFSANGGYFCSAKGNLTFREVEAKVDAGLQLIDHMVLFCIEQPFLNYLVVTSGKPYTSLWSLAQHRSLDIPFEKWGGDPLKLQSMEDCRTAEHRIFMVHWAGIWRPSFFEVLAVDVARKLGFSAKLPPVRRFLPNRELWRYYRYMSDEMLANRLLSRRHALDSSARQSVT
jgi:hypothetical protein